MAERRAEARKEVAQAALETELSTRAVEALRRSAEEGWRSEQDAGRLKTRTVWVCEEALARAQRELERARATQDPTELREVGLKAVRTADMDTLYAMAVHAAAADGADVNTRPEAAAGEEPQERWLRLTANEGLVETVRALVEAGAEVNHADNEGLTALHGAAAYGHVEVTKALLEAGAEVNRADNEGYTALHRAAENCHVEVIKVLLEAGAEVDHANNEGVTALFGAAEGGHVEVIKVLLEAGAAINHAANNGHTPLASARAKQQEAAAQALMQAGATAPRRTTRTSR